MNASDTRIRSGLHFIIFLVVAIGASIFVLYKAEEAVTEIQKLSELPAMSAHRLGTAKDIIYFNEPRYKEWSEKKMREHCEAVGGKFNACGSVCRDPGKPCIQVCAPQCNFY